METLKNEEKVKEYGYCGKDQPEYGYWCKVCGKADHAIAYYSENVYGVATVIDPNGELDDYEDEDRDNFSVDEYKCLNCNTRKTDLEDLITTDWNEVCKIIDKELQQTRGGKV